MLVISLGRDSRCHFGRLSSQLYTYRVPGRFHFLGITNQVRVLRRRLAPVGLCPGNNTLDIVRRQRLHRRRAERRAIAELSTYSDARLQDIGLSRGAIAHAVRHGRIGSDAYAAAGAAGKSTGAGR